MTNGISPLMHSDGLWWNREHSNNTPQQRDREREGKVQKSKKIGFHQCAAGVGISSINIFAVIECKIFPYSSEQIKSFTNNGNGIKRRQRSSLAL